MLADYQVVDVAKPYAEDSYLEIERALLRAVRTRPAVVGRSTLPEDDFVNRFAADVDPVKAKVIYAVQQPLSTTAFQDVMGVPAWKSLPSWYLVTDGDQAIPPDAERLFAKLI